MNEEQDTMKLPTISEVLNDPCASSWIKNAIKSAMSRDAVDALNDAEFLVALLAQGVADANNNL